jgi:hypothetical protein
MANLSPFSKFMLRVTRVVKPGEPIPDMISPGTYDRAASRFRIGLYTSLMVGAAVASFVVIVNARKERDRIRANAEKTNPGGS